MMLACRRDLPSIQLLMLSGKQEALGPIFQSLSLVWPGRESNPDLPNHKATELVPPLSRSIE